MTGALESDGRIELRDRLAGMRAELAEQMARDGIDGGDLALLTGINAAIEACGLAPAMVENTMQAGRVVVSDDSREMRLTLYSEAGAVATVTLTPARAVAVAGELIAAALPRLRAT